jgi:hypothetical protein
MSLWRHVQHRDVHPGGGCKGVIVNNSPPDQLTNPPSHGTQYVTYFDRHYLTRGVALLRSLLRCSPSARVWVICLDAQTQQALTALHLQNIRLVSLADLEARDPELTAVRQTRSLLEYYYTLTAPSLLYVLATDPTIDRLVYLDADTFFFSDPEPLFARYQDSSMLLLEHRYPPELHVEYKYGRFNVGLIVLNRSEARQRCLELWRKQCVAWCYDRVEGNQYGDQGYLNQWPELYDDVSAPSETGIGLAPWNIRVHAFAQQDGQLLVDGEPVIHVHFSSTRRITARLYDTGAHRYRFTMSDTIKRYVYTPYVCALAEAEQLLHDTSGIVMTRDSIRRKRFERFGVLGRISTLLTLLATIRRRNLLVVPASGYPRTRPIVQPSEAAVRTSHIVTVARSEHAPGLSNPGDTSHQDHDSASTASAWEGSSAAGSRARPAMGAHRRRLA